MGESVGFVAVRRPKGRGFVIQVADDAGVIVGTVGGNRAARAAAVVVHRVRRDDGVLFVDIMCRQDIAAADSHARSIRSGWNGRSVAGWGAWAVNVLPVIKLADFDPMAPIYVYGVNV